MELEEKLKFLENLEDLKTRFKIKSDETIDDWNSYKKKLQYTKKPVLVKNNKLIFLKNLIIKKILINLKLYFLVLKNLSIKIKRKNFNINKTVDYLFNVSDKKIKTIINKNNWINKNPLFIIIDQRSLKTKIVFFNKNNCLSTITNGLAFKKLQFNNKKYKKSEKISLLSAKIIIFKMQNYIFNKNIIIHVKGLKRNNNNLIKYFNKMIVKYKCLNSIYLNNYMMSNNKYFKFKKIKAIKRRLKKKIIKLK